MDDGQRYSLQMLNEHHPVNRFVCEDDLFNDYLRDEALYDMENGLALTFVALDPTLPDTENIAGFFTVRTHSQKYAMNTAMPMKMVPNLTI